jgi:hypothetical protein
MVGYGASAGGAALERAYESGVAWRNNRGDPERALEAFGMEWGRMLSRENDGGDLSE